MTRALLLLVLLATTGCAITDPYRRRGMWQPEGVNAGNIAAQVADPRVLVRGHGQPGGTRDGVDAAERLVQGRPLGLPTVTGGGGAPAGAPPAAQPAPPPPTPSPAGAQ
jgi:hypothetical protein